MNLGILGPIISAACLVATIFITYRVRRAKLIYITDFQVGLRFRDGKQWVLLNPGSYLTYGSRNPITLVDMRPYPFIFERMRYKDRLLRNFVISVAGELMVRDPRIALSTLKTLVDDALTIAREGLRIAASQVIVELNPEAREGIATALSAEINRGLEAHGVEIQNLEITELWIPPFNSGLSATAN